MFDAGTRTFVERDLHVAVRRIVVAEHGERAMHRDAGRVGGNEDHRLLLMRGASGSVLPITIYTLQRGSPAPDDHHLWPLIT
jgi:hypothetical protein